MRAAAALLLLFLAPTALAGVAFEVEMTDARYDTVRVDGRAVNVTQADILSFSSRVEDGVVRQRVEMAARPQAPADSILVRNWYANSTNGSWHVVDLEVRGDEPDPAKRFHPLRREGDFFNATVIDAQYGLDGDAWIFSFDAALVADAACFDPAVFSEHTPARAASGPHGVDALYLRERRCTQTQEPAPPTPPPIRAGVPPLAEPTAAPPGSVTPTPGPALLALVAAVALAVLVRTRRAP